MGDAVDPIKSNPVPNNQTKYEKAMEIEREGKRKEQKQEKERTQ